MRDSGATPIKVISLYLDNMYVLLLIQNFSIPVAKPESIIIALVFKAALLIPANSFPLFLVFAPIRTIVGVGS